MTSYSTIDGARHALRYILDRVALPASAKFYANKALFTGRDNVILPCVMKEAEASAALKAIEAGCAAAIGELRFGWSEDKIEISMERANLFLFMTYVSTVDDMNKFDKAVCSKLRDTDFNQAQSIVYRRLSANLYRTARPGQYYHIHGSLEASPALEMVGLPAYREDLTDYSQILEYIGSAVSKYTVEELEEMNAERKLAGVMALKHDEFLKTSHGRVVSQQPYWMVDAIETTTPPVPFAASDTTRPQVLSGIRVLELCRIIAGPTITRILAEYGAEVLKITPPTGPDVPFFQVDGNLGKHAAELDLKSLEGRGVFEELLESADVVVDGYRPGAIGKLGYGLERLVGLATKRGKGIVYVSENCFGYDAPWAHRAGWQQIADCVSGLAWAQGRAMGQDEPIIPPFPMSDYGTGCMGAIAALTGLYKRAAHGGSYWGKVSLVQYDLLLFDLVKYPEEVWKKVYNAQDESFKQMRYNDSVDRIGESALKGLRKTAPFYWDDAARYLEEWESSGFKGKINVVRPVVYMGRTWNGFLEPSRPNGWDAPSWWRT